MENPYRKLPERAFWKKAISEKSHFDISELYQKKYSISATDRLVTAGSCFAQHIAKKLHASGYNYCDYEQAPKYFPQDQFPVYNYGVYSARYCNIYTVRQLRQTIERAFGLRPYKDLCWEKKDGFVDPFRPALEPEPFETVPEMSAAREGHYRAVRKVFSECDVFIFTMGLTEAWVDAGTGDVYPLCPGTQGGVFDDRKHKFHNFGFVEIVEDLNWVLAFLKKHNPNIRMLLTVSPVPLVASASGHHVLPATVYSKSILRAVAGHMLSEHENVDYFPSFEIASAHPFKGLVFEPNQREVNLSGVDFIMTHFFDQHPPLGADAAAPAKDTDKSKDEVVCEEMLLEQEAPK
jgi:hypothetical protein